MAKLAKAIKKSANETRKANNRDERVGHDAIAFDLHQINAMELRLVPISYKILNETRKRLGPDWRKYTLLPVKIK